MFLYILFLLNIFCIGYLSAMENQGSGSIKPAAVYTYIKRGFDRKREYRSQLDQTITSPQSPSVKNSKLEAVNEPDLDALPEESPVKKQKVVHIEPLSESSNVTVTKINRGENNFEQKKEKQKKDKSADSQNKQERKILSWMGRSAGSNKFAAKKRELKEKYAIELPGSRIQCRLCRKVLEAGYFFESHIGQHQGLWNCPHCKLNASSNGALKQHAPICPKKPS